MAKGEVSWFNNAKGYGFIKRSDETDIFVHYSAIAGDGYKSLSEGDEVEFSVVNGAKGLQADNVRVTKKAPGKRQGNEAPQKSYSRHRA